MPLLMKFYRTNHPLKNKSEVEKMLKLKTGTFAGMAKDIKSRNSGIVIFGTGVIGSTVTPEILKSQGLIDRIAFCIDNDKTRWNTTINMCGKQVAIHNPEILTTHPDDLTVLIAISRYQSALEQLQRLTIAKDFSCYIIPAMCIDNFHNDGGKGVIKTSDKPLIPKKIHYMWLGGNPLPDKLQKCIDTWEKYCPDYEIIRWDESNYDVHKNQFVSQAYDNKKYGFVPDYARIELLYEHGGIYLDTDIELQRNLDELLYQEAFCSVEKWQVLNFGGCSGAIKGHKSLEPFLDTWRKRSLIRHDGTLDIISSGLIDTSVALKAGYTINGRNQTVMGMNIYTYDYFHPYDYMSGKLEKTDDTFSIHQFQGGWLDDKAKADNLRATCIFDELMKQAEVVE